MTNSEFRAALQARILALKNNKEALTDNDFYKYRKYLLTLCQIDCLSVLRQEKIHTASFGDIIGFVVDFIDYISPFLSRGFKKIHCSDLQISHKSILFSPRLTEIALGCILRSFFKNTDNVKFSFFSTSSYIVVSILGKAAYPTGNDLACASKSLRLQSGRIICEAYNDYTRINLMFSILPRLEPIRLVPCSTELCRLCRI